MLLKSVSTLYSENPHRCIMEFVDNAIDAANTYYNAITNSYKKKLKSTSSLTETVMSMPES